MSGHPPFRRAARLAAVFLIAASARAQTIRFEDVAAEAGVVFRFDNGSRGKHDLPEIMGGGVALFDADGDGRLDIFLCDGGPIVPDPKRDDPPCRLFRNRGDGRFDDVTATAGAPGPSFAMGAAAADYDGDGRTDLFVSGWRGQRLYRNLGGCRFEDVTERAGLASLAWTTSAAWADLDGDGDLDLYVASYVDYDPETAPFCAAPDGKRDYCGPEDFEAQADRLYRNNGDGTFTNVAEAAGLPNRAERGLGVLIADLNGDGRPDVFVANDGGRCWLLANRGNLRFDETGVEAGVALDRAGGPLAGMGTALADLDGDGLSDLIVTNFLGRSTIGFRAVEGAPGLYQDDSDRLGLVGPTRGVLGFGLIAVDFDGDGRLDLLQANGHVLDRARLGTPFAMRPTLLRGRPGGFDEASKTAGDWFSRPILGRGLAVGDIDGDGRPDIVAAALDAPAAVLLNRSPSGHSLRLNLIDRRGLPAIGARVSARVGDRLVTGDLIGGGSYLSSSPPGLILGLGEASRADLLEVQWPWGGLETWRDLDANRPLQLREGTSPATTPKRG